MSHAVSSKKKKYPSMKDKVVPSNPELYEKFSPGFKYCQPKTTIIQFQEGVRAKGANALGGYGRTALMWACANGKEDMYTFLQEQNADLNIQDEVFSRKCVICCHPFLIYFAISME